MGNNVQGIPGRNGGVLNPGGTPGNRGGGRPKDEIRALAREGAFKGIGKLIAKLESGEELPPGDVARITDILAKYGVGTESKVETVDLNPQLWGKVLGDVLEWAESNGVGKEFSEFLSTYQVPKELAGD